MRKPSFSLRALTVALIGSLVCPPQAFAKPASKAQLLGLPSFQALAITIGNINRAMRIAAESPLDEPNRLLVRQAVAQLPLAIVGIAKDFQGRTLGSSSLPLVMSMLGGFVDQSAPDTYDKFLRHPSKDLIPKVGADFPKEYLNASSTGSAGGASSLVMMDKRSVATEQNSLVAGRKNIAGDQVVNLGTIDLSSATPHSVTTEAPAKAEVSNKAEATEVSDRDLASVQTGLVKDIAAFEAASANPTTAVNGVSVGASYDAPASLTVNAVSEKAKLEKQRDQEASALFKSIGKGNVEDEIEEDAVIGKRHKDIKKAAIKKATKKQSSKPTSWRLAPLFYLAGFMFGENAQAAGEGGNSDEEEGNKAADILFGIAAIVATIVPIFAAQAQADAQVQSAQTQANAQIQMTTMQAKVSQDLAKMSAQTAEKQALAAKDIADQNNRQQLQVQQLVQANEEKRWAREDAALKETRAIEQQYNNDRIKIAQAQADQNIQLAQAALNAQVVQAGLATGYKGANSANNGLSVANINQTASTQSSTTALSNGALTAVAQTQAAANGTAVGLVSSSTANKPKVASSLGLKPTTVAPQNRLLASVDTQSVANLQAKALTQAKGQGLVATQGATTLTLKVGGVKRGLATARGTYAHGLAPMAAGSFAKERFVIPEDKQGSDLSQFAMQAVTRSNEPSFGDWRNERREGAAVTATGHIR